MTSEGFGANKSMNVLIFKMKHDKGKYENLKNLFHELGKDGQGTYISVKDRNSVLDLMRLLCYSKPTWLEVDSADISRAQNEIESSFQRTSCYIRLAVRKVIVRCLTLLLDNWDNFVEIEVPHTASDIFYCLTDGPNLKEYYYHVFDSLGVTYSSVKQSLRKITLHGTQSEGAFRSALQAAGDININDEMYLEIFTYTGSVSVAVGENHAYYGGGLISDIWAGAVGIGSVGLLKEVLTESTVEK